MKDKKELEASIDSIIHGLFYLSLEAENAKLVSISNLLVNTISEISGWIDNNSEELKIKPCNARLNNSFVAAIEFLAKFAAINDTTLRNEVIDEIKKLAAQNERLN